MKKVFFLFFCTLFLASFAQAQGLQIINPADGAILNGSFTTVSGNPASADISKSLWVKNLSGSTLAIKVTRIELAIVSGTDNATCWDFCPPQIAAGSQPVQVSVTVSLADSAQENSFAGHLYPNNNSGCSHYRYIFSDSTAGVIDSVDIYFSHGAVCVTSVEELAEIGQSLQLFPNPAQEQLNIDLGQSIEKGELFISNSLGQIVYRQNLQGTANVLQVPLKDLDNGIYSITIIADKKRLATQRFQVLK